MNMIKTRENNKKNKNLGINNKRKTKINLSSNQMSKF